MIDRVEMKPSVQIKTNGPKIPYIAYMNVRFEMSIAKQIAMIMIDSTLFKLKMFMKTRLSSKIIKIS